MTEEPAKTTGCVMQAHSLFRSGIAGEVQTSTV